MHRQTSQVQRDEDRKIIKSSLDTKPTSKAKKTKLPTQQPEKKYQNYSYKNVQDQESKNRTYNIKEFSHSRLVQKLALVEKLANKCLDKQQKKCFIDLIRLITKQENLRTIIQSNERQNNREKNKQQKDLLRHILQKQQTLINDSQISPFTLNTCTSIFSNNIIAKQMSPKMNIEVHGFSDFNKKKEDSIQKQYLMEMNKKDKVIKRLFQQVENLQRVKDSFDSKLNFAQNINSLNSKMMESNKQSQKIKRLQEQSQKKDQNYKELDQFAKTQIQNYQIDYNQLCEDYSRLQKRCIDLQKKVKLLLLQKQEWERKYDRLKKQTKAKEEKNRTYEQGLKAKLGQILNYQIIQMRNIQKLSQRKLREDLDIIRGATFSQVMHLNALFNKQLEKLRSQQSQFVQKCEGLQTRLQDEQKNVLYLKKINQELISSVNPSMHSKNEIFSLIVNQSFQPISSNKHFKIHAGLVNMEIRRLQKLSKGTQKDQQSTCFKLVQLQNMSINSKKVTNQIEVQVHFYEQIYLTNQQICQFGFQTQNLLQIKQNTKFTQTETKLVMQSYTQIQSIQNLQVSTLTDIRKLQKSLNTVNLAIQSEKKDIFKVQKPAHQILTTLNVSLYRKASTSDVETQTQSNQLNIQFFQECQLIDYPKTKNCLQDCDILKMLSDAQQCIMIPQIAILKQQNLNFREQIERLRATIRQHEKEKEQESVFNFRL